MGEVRVPALAKWGAQTQRAVENFPISGQVVERSLIAALALVKGAAAAVNAELGTIAPDVAEALQEAAREVAAGTHRDQFPIDVFQTGSGTSTNMNMNEVLAHLASEHLGREVRPNDEPNASQSSNDTFPSAIHLAAVREIVNDLIPALRTLAGALSDQATALAAVVKSGRTHLMDATPVTLGQEFGGYAAAVSYGFEPRCRAWLSSRSAGPRSGPASTPRRSSPRRSSPGWQLRPVSRSRRPATISRPRALAMRSSRRPA